MLRLLGTSLLVGVLCVFAGASSQHASADPAITGYPDSMATLGDSISRGFDADPGTFGEQLENVWSTGSSPSVNSIYSRILAVHPAISGNRFNDAVSGAKMNTLNTQAGNAVAQHPAMVFILMGGNDLCTSSEATMTTAADYQTQFQAAMQTLTTGLPDARIGVISIPDVYNLWAILHGNTSAQGIWSTFSICQALLANPTSMAPADVTRRANVRQRNMDLNTVLHDVCAQYVHCRFDNYLGFNTVFTTSDVSTIDYFHPSLTGQANIAAAAWPNGWDFTEVNPPVSGSSGPMSMAGTTVTLTATDDVGVNGIEYKVDAGAYQKYTAPFLITPDHTFTWRAVDVNGNSEATHTCSVRFWAWPSGDTDCDGFPDSVMALGKAPEPAIGTDPALGCAATSTANDEPTPDAMPMDFNDDQIISGQDTGRYGGPFGAFNHLVSAGPFGPPGQELPGARFDLNADGAINGGDTGKFAMYFNRKCV
jgi:lysophospholipase L1-like esterase